MNGSGCSSSYGIKGKKIRTLAHKGYEVTQTKSSRRRNALMSVLLLLLPLLFLSEAKANPPTKGKGHHKKKIGPNRPTVNGLDTNIPCGDQAACIIKKGYKFMGRYYSHSLLPKDLTASEVAQFSTAGLLKFVFYENYGSAAQTQDYASGYSDGQAAYNYAFSTIHQPTNTPIYFCIDYDPGTNSTTAENIRQYFAGIHVGLNDAQAAKGASAPTYAEGAYAPGYTLQDLSSWLYNGKPLVTFTCISEGFGQTGTVAYGKSNAWNVWQHTPNPTVCGMSFDADWSAGKSGSW